MYRNNPFAYPHLTLPHIIFTLPKWISFRGAGQFASQLVTVIIVFRMFVRSDVFPHFQMLEESGPGDLLSSIRFLKARTADLTV